MRARAYFLGAFSALGLLSMAGAARAQTWTASPVTQGGQSQAAALFSVVTGTGCGGNGCLQVVLQNNTSAFTAYHNPDVLDGIVFDVANVAGNPVTLTPWSASTASTLFNAGACTGGSSACTISPPTTTTINVGHEWGYKFSSTGYQGTFTGATFTTTARYAIGGAGFSSLTGWGGWSNYTGSGTPPNIGSNLDGVDFGIVGANYTGGSGTSGSSPLVNASVTFEFGLPAGVSSLNFSNLMFLYGTAPDGTAGGNQAPEPASLALLLTALAGIGMQRHRSRARAARVVIG